MPTVAEHFERSEPHVRATYDRVLNAARTLGSVEEDPKKTSIHLNRRSAFAGVSTQKAALILTLKSTEDIESARIRKHQRASARRWYLDITLEKPSDVDAELRKWLAQSYALSD